MDAQSAMMLTWTSVALQATGLWSLMVARFGRGRWLTTAARVLFLISLVGLGVCSAACGPRAWAAGLSAAITLPVLLLGICGES